MCQKLIEKYSCGHNEIATFPCEDLLTDGDCKKTDEDKLIDHADRECRECQHMADALKQIAEDAKLAPEPRRGGEEVRDPNAPKKYFIEYIKWSKCGHHSHPKSTDIERFDDGPELGFEIEGLGRCHGCSEADPQTLARMEKSGALAKTDPWGAMDREPDVATGSSGAGADQPSTEAIALNITNSALKDLRTGAGRGSGAGGSSNTTTTAAVTAGRRAIGDLPSRSPSPEFDTTPGKGKSRCGHEDEKYASRYGAAPSESDFDDDEAFRSDDDESKFKASPPHDRRGRSPPGRGGRPNRRSRSEDTDSDDEPPAHDRHDRSPPARGGPPNRRPHAKYDSDEESPPPGFHSDEDEDHHHVDADDADDDEKGLSISASERQRLAIPPGFKVTQKSLMRFEARRAEEGRLAMRQHNSGEVDD